MNRTRSTALALLTVLVAGATARAQTTGGVAGVRDGAGMFSAEAVKEADDALKDVRRKTHWSALVETVETLDGKSVKDAAIDNARAVHEHGLYLLIAKKEHKFYAEPSGLARKAFDHAAITKLEGAITDAFKAGKFDQGLLDAVALIRHDAEAAPDTTHTTASTPPPAPAPKPAPIPLSTKKYDTPEPEPEPEPKPAEKSIMAGKPDAPAPATKAARGPAAPVVPDLPRPTPEPVAKTTEPAPNTEVAFHEAGSMLPILLLGGGAVLLVLWLLSRAFRGGAPAPQANTQTGPTVHYGPGVVPTPMPGPGYAPQPPVRPVYPTPPQRPGYGPPPQPGYAPPPQPGYGPPQQPGYGYAPPPPQHGGVGGFISGALGGAAGAVAGNILYDKFGRPHEGPGNPTHIPGGVVVPPHHEPSWPQGDTGPEPVVVPGETYDPNAGGGGDWGTPDPVTQQAANVDPGAGGDWGTPEPAADVDAGAGGDWGTPEPVADVDAGAGGDWGSPEPAPEPEPPADAGGDWGTPDEPADTGGGGDWGGADPGTDDNQGGSW